MNSVQMGVGGGIVLDSRCTDEYEESQLKARFATGLDPGFALFESIRVSRTGAVRHLCSHIDRMSASAQRLGFACDGRAMRQSVIAVALALPRGEVHRLRLTLEHDGQFVMATNVLERDADPISEQEEEKKQKKKNGNPRQFFVADHCLTKIERALVGHKTTCRSTYDNALVEAKARGAFDVLFLNEKGELTEGARSNVFLKLNGRWWTPPLECGLLPGTMRAHLLSISGIASERILTRSDLERADEVMLCNSLRGCVRTVVAKWVS